MRKIYTLLIACGVGITAMAQPLVINKIPADTEININGAEDEGFWDQVDAQNVEAEKDGDYDQANFYEAYFKMAYNDTALFLIIFRSEDELSTQYETGIDDWQSDRDEIFFDVAVNTLTEDTVGASDSQNWGDQSVEGATVGHYQFTTLWSAGENEAEDGVQQEWSGWITDHWYHNAPYMEGWTIVGNDYTCEYVFPFSSLTVDTDISSENPEQLPNTEGTVFGMEIAMVDVDASDNPTDQNFRSFVNWFSATADPWTSMPDDNTGRIELGPELAPTSVTNFVESNMAVYPNPANNYITIENAGVVNVDFYDISGRAVKSVNNVSPNNQINVSDLNSGLYIIEITDADNNRSIGRFKKQ